MQPVEVRHLLLPSGGEEGFTRRRFLAGLGVLAGAGAIGPLLGRLGRDPRHAVEVRRPVLGTWGRIVVNDADRARAGRSIDDAFAAIARVDAQMSVHRGDSELSAVNAASGHAARAVGPEVRTVVARARAAAEASDGLYDPTVLPLMRVYGFYGERDRRPGDREIGRALELVDWRRVADDPVTGTLGLERAGAGLDLGSIGKGWALDRAVASLRASGVESALVDLGGNVYGLGTPDAHSDAWSVGVLHPRTNAVDAVFKLRDSAVATSANNERFRVLGGVRVGHLFDARTGLPSDGRLAASVQASTGLESDVLSTVAFLSGPSRFTGGASVLRTHFIG